MGAADGGRRDLVRNVEVPDRGAAARGELRHHLRHVGEILEGPSGEPEAAGNAGEVSVAEHRSLLGHSLGAELVHLGAVGAVVDDDDQDLQAMTPDGFQLLHVHHQAAIAVE